MTETRSMPPLTVASDDLRWLMAIMQSAQYSYSVTVMHTTHAVSELTDVRLEGHPCVIASLTARDSATDVRDLLDRSPGCRFVFVADTLPLRHAVARVIREHGHAFVGRDEAPFVIVATAAALIAETEAGP